MAALEGTGTITVKGNFDTIPQSWGGNKYRGAAIGGTMAFSYAAQVVEVTIDPDTAEVHVDKVWVAHDCGKALNPLAVEGQVEGSVWMGMGQALTEETRYHDGLWSTGSMLDYRVPTIVESPPIEAHIVESNDPARPVRRQGSGRGFARRLHPRRRQRDRGRARRARHRAADHARPADGDPGEEGTRRARGGEDQSDGGLTWSTCRISRCTGRRRSRRR